MVSALIRPDLYELAASGRGLRSARRASASSIGEKSGQPIWSSRPKIPFETTVASQPG